MSVEALVKLRTRRLVPTTVWVIVGALNTKRWLLERPDVIQLDTTPDLLDLRALKGLSVDLFGTSDERIFAAHHAVERAGAKVIGICGPSGCVGANDQHKTVLQKAWRLLCN